MRLFVTFNKSKWNNGLHNQVPRPTGSVGSLVGQAARRTRQRASVCKCSTKRFSFSTVSILIFAREDEFCSIFQNSPDSQTEFFEI